MFKFFLINFSLFFSLSIALHFLGGSFTYRRIQQANNEDKHLSILVELRFHISNHFFICTPEQVNQHLIVYLIGVHIDYDNQTKKYLWHNTNLVEKNPNYYKIKCISQTNNRACANFTEEIWGYCESANQISGYSIIRRQFLLVVEKFKPIELSYTQCCWADSYDKPFFFNLSIDTSQQINSSPYAHIPASYYVDINRRTPNFI